jgi:hypothetical protein
MHQGNRLVEMVRRHENGTVVMSDDPLEAGPFFVLIELAKD